MDFSVEIIFPWGDFLSVTILERACSAFLQCSSSCCLCMLGHLGFIGLKKNTLNVLLSVFSSISCCCNAVARGGFELGTLLQTSCCVLLKG